jgi:hypothetical protein
MTRRPHIPPCVVPVPPGLPVHIAEALLEKAAAVWQGEAADVRFYRQGAEAKFQWHPQRGKTLTLPGEVAPPDGKPGRAAPVE